MSMWLLRGTLEWRDCRGAVSGSRLPIMAAAGRFYEHVRLHHSVAHHHTAECPPPPTPRDLEYILVVAPTYL